MSKRNTNGATITVVSTGKSYHTLRDFGLAMANNNPVGDVQQETFYVDVPGADGYLDYSEALTGRPIFKERPIEMKLAGKRGISSWQAFISKLRVLFHGKKVRVVFDDFPGYYWEGRAEIKEYDRARHIGTFVFAIPKADPYAYSLNDNSNPDWLWDPFDFEISIIEEPLTFVLTSAEDTTKCTIQHSAAPFAVFIDVESVGGAGLFMELDGDSYVLGAGRNQFSELIVDDKDIELKFRGVGKFTVTYRRRTL